MPEGAHDDQDPVDVDRVGIIGGVTELVAHVIVAIARVFGR